MRFYNKRRTAEQWIKEGKQAVKMTRLSCHRYVSNDGALFTREDAVEASWAVVDPVLKHRQRIHPYKRGSWGPKEAGAILGPNDSWHNPAPGKVSG